MIHLTEAEEREILSEAEREHRRVMVAWTVILFAVTLALVAFVLALRLMVLPW